MAKPQESLNGGTKMEASNSTIGKPTLGREKWMTRMLCIVGVFLIVSFAVLAVLVTKAKEDLGKAEKERKDAMEKLAEAAKERKGATDKLSEAAKERKGATDALALATRERKDAANALAEAEKERKNAVDALAEATKKRKAAADAFENAEKERKSASGILVEAAKERKGATDALAKAEKERKGAANALAEAERERKSAANALAEAAKKSKDAADVLAKIERKEKALADKETKLNDLVRVYGLQEASPLTIEDVDAILLLINHINWVVTKIKSANDPIVLEQEYESINQNALYLDAIKDREVVNIVCNIMDVIVDMRIDAKEREMLQEELDQGMSDAIYDAVPNPTSLFSLNPISAICNLATAAVSSYANYRKAKIRLAKQFKKATWDLDKNKMVFLNELNKNLLRNYWELVNRHGLQDKYRVVESDIEHLIERLKDGNARRVHDFLSTADAKERYKALPQYWYYRGSNAYACGELKDAEESLVQYQSYIDKHGDFLRHNRLSAHAAMLRLNIIAQKHKVASAGEGVFGGHEKEVRRQVKEIEKHSNYNDWQSLYYAAVVSSQIGDSDEARDILKRLIDEYEAIREKKFVNWKDLVEMRSDADATNSVKSVSAQDVVYTCRKLLASIEKHDNNDEGMKKQMEAICHGELVSLREQLLCYGELGYEKALERLTKGVEDVRGFVKDGSFYVFVPLSWAIGTERKFQLFISSGWTDLSDARFLRGNMLLEDEHKRGISQPTPDAQSGRVRLAFVSNGGVKVKNNQNVVLTAMYSCGSCVGKRIFRIAIRFSNVGEVPVKPDQTAIGEWEPSTDPTLDSTWKNGHSKKIDL